MSISYDRDRFRIRADGVGLNSTSFVYPVNVTPDSWPVGVAQRLRFLIAAFPVGGTQEADFRLYFARPDTLEQIEVTATSPYIRLKNSPHFTNGDATSEVLVQEFPGEPFVPGRGIDGAGAGTIEFPETPEGYVYTEIEWCIEAWDDPVGGTRWEVGANIPLWIRDVTNEVWLMDEPYFGLTADDSERAGDLGLEIDGIGVLAEGQAEIGPITGEVDHSLEPITGEAAGTIALRGTLIQGWTIEQTAAGDGTIPVRGTLMGGWQIDQGLQSEATAGINGDIGLQNVQDIDREVSGQIDVLGTLMGGWELDISAAIEGVVGHVPISGDGVGEIEIEIEATAQAEAAGVLDTLLDGVSCASDGSVIVGCSVYSLADNEFIECAAEGDGFTGWPPISGELPNQLLEDAGCQTEGVAAVEAGLEGGLWVDVEAIGNVPESVTGEALLTLEDAGATSEGVVATDGILYEGWVIEQVVDASGMVEDQPGREGDLLITLDDLAETFDGTAEVGGSMELLADNTFIESTLECDVLVDLLGALDSGPGDVLLELDGAAALNGELDQTCDDSTLDGTGTFEAEGVCDVTLEDITQEIDGVVLVSGECDAGTDEVTLESIGEVKGGRRLAFII